MRFHCVYLLVVEAWLELEGPEGNIQRRCSAEFKVSNKEDRKIKV